MKVLYGCIISLALIVQGCSTQTSLNVLDSLASIETKQDLYDANIDKYIAKSLENCQKSISRSARPMECYIDGDEVKFRLKE